MEEINNKILSELYLRYQHRDVCFLLLLYIFLLMALRYKAIFIYSFIFIFNARNERIINLLLKKYDICNVMCVCVCVVAA